MYDWANSAFATTVMAGFFPVFFKQYWSTGSDAVFSTAKLGFANSASGIIIALLAPALGAIADRGSAKKRFLFAFCFLGIATTAAFYGVPQGNWQMAAALYVLAMIGYLGGNIFYDALLTSVAPLERRDRVSSLGYAYGYLGGGILFAVNVLMAIKPEMFGIESAAQGVKLSFLSVGVWWAVFSIPLFLLVKEQGTTREESVFTIIGEGLAQLKNTFLEVRHLKTIFLFLAAYWLYIDGVNTIIVMALDYGLSIGFKSQDLIVALLMTQFIAFPAAIGFGHLGQKIGTKRAISIGIAVYIFACIWGAFMENKVEFFILAGMIGLVQGGVQALSRSLYSRIIPVNKSAEYFGFYNMLSKFATVIGPILIGGTGLLADAMGYSGQLTSRIGITSIAVLFLSGGMLLQLVNEEKGREEAAYLSGK
jgi:UMF1 family MFS transporter